jgi:heat shock transcription factor 1
LDIEKFSNIVLPRFFIHKNYNTFIRQLNIYGFSKNKNKLVEGEGYSHEIFNKNTSKEEIKKIKRKKKLINT